MADPFVNAVRQDMAHAVELGAARLVGEALQELAGQGKNLRYLGEALVKGGFSPTVMRNVHQEVGNKALRSAAQAYTHRRHRRGLPSYREGDPTRFAGGRLNRALRNSINVVATDRTLKMYDRAFLDAEAGQWYRLNFGAGQAGAGSNNPQSFPVRLRGGGALFNIAITGEVSEPFRLPPGVFIGKDGKRVKHGENPPGSDPFYWRGGARPPGGFGRGRIPGVRMTRGIEANNYLDAAAARIARELGPAYDRVLEDAIKGGNAASRLKKTVKAAKPVRFNPVFRASRR